MLNRCGPPHGDARPQGGEERYKKVAFAKLNGEVKFLFNSRRSYVACVKQVRPTARNPLPPLDFLVYDLKKDEIVFEESLPNGKLEWVSDDELEVTVTPGTVQMDQEVSRYLYHVKSRTRTLSRETKK